MTKEGVSGDILAKVDVEVAGVKEGLAIHLSSSHAAPTATTYRSSYMPLWNSSFRVASSSAPFSCPIEGPLVATATAL